MTDIYPGNLEIIDRYLANRLSDAERELVETRIVGEPAFRHEVELTEALRDGLRELQAQGEVAPLLSPRTWMWSRSPIAIAASVMALVFGVTAFLLYQRLDQPQQDLRAASGELVVATLLFERIRSAQPGPDVSWERSAAPTLLEMRFDVGLEPAAAYRVQVEWIGAGPDATLLLATPAVVGPEGGVSISLHSALLEPGNYRIRLEPLPSASMDQESIVYTLRVTG